MPGGYHNMAGRVASGQEVFDITGRVGLRQEAFKSRGLGWVALTWPDP